MLKTVFWILVVLFFGVAMVGRKNPSKPILAAGVALCCGLLAVSIGLFVQSSQNPNLRPLDRTFETAAGYRIGLALVEDLPAGSQVLVVNVPKKFAVTQDLREAYLSGLQEALRGNDITLQEAPEEVEEEAYMSTMGEEGRSVLEVVESTLASPTSSEADAVVSFMGLSDRPSAALLENLPPFYIVHQSTVSGSLVRFIRSGDIAGIVMFREDLNPLAKPDPSASLTEVFNSYYQYVSATD